jgi:hypothetical protein
MATSSKTPTTIARNVNRLRPRMVLDAVEFADWGVEEAVGSWKFSVAVELSMAVFVGDKSAAEEEGEADGLMREDAPGTVRQHGEVRLEAQKERAERVSPKPHELDSVVAELDVMHEALPKEEVAMLDLKRVAVDVRVCLAVVAAPGVQMEAFEKRAVAESENAPIEEAHVVAPPAAGAVGLQL